MNYKLKINVNKNECECCSLSQCADTQLYHAATSIPEDLAEVKLLSACS